MPVVETSSGRVRGRIREAGLAFTGIPYARPPVGALRFRPPEPPEPWTDVRSALVFGAAAPQPPFDRINRKETLAEDCLYLNVLTPAADGAKRPVLVWLHGGGFVSGAGSFGEYDGSAFVADGDLVFVSLNYRLGALGWLAAGHGSDLAGIEANCGLLDQLAALRWVSENISAFGGDPTNVTVCGQSAGAMCIGSLLSLPQASGLFRRAILQSGTSEHLLARERAAAKADRFLDLLGVRREVDLRRADTARILDAQQRVLAEGNADYASGGPSSMLTFGPVDDAGILSSRSGHPDAPIPILVGSNIDECQLVARGQTVTLEAWSRLLAGRVRDVDALVAHYHRREGDTRDALGAAYTGALYGLPAMRTAESWSSLGGRAFRYLFAWRPPRAVSGAVHSREVPFVFGSTTNSASQILAGPDPPAVLEAAMHASWIAFVREGDPSHGGLPAWRPYDEARTTLVFDRSPHAVADPDGEERTVWSRGP